jgi:hypothetical protein
MSGNLFFAVRNFPLRLLLAQRERIAEYTPVTLTYQ